MHNNTEFINKFNTPVKVTIFIDEICENKPQKITYCDAAIISCNGQTATAEPGTITECKLKSEQVLKLTLEQYSLISKGTAFVENIFSE